MVFKAKGQHRFKVRVTSNTHTTSRILSTGTDDKATAQDVERFVRTMKSRRQWSYLDAILTNAVGLPDAYDANVRGELDAFMAAAIGQAADPDVDALVAEWETRGTDPVYVRMVRSLVPKGKRFPLSNYRRKTISDHLASLTVGIVTKRKYRTAFSMFARWLIEQERIEANPARDVSLGDAPTRPLVFLNDAQARVLVPTIEWPAQRALEALMMGSGIEWQAADRIRPEDIDADRRMVHAYGSKNEHRDRWIEVTEDWCWDIFWAFARSVIGRPIFADIGDRRRVLDRHKARCHTMKLPSTTLHQYRHAFAVMWIRRGATGGLRTDNRDKQWLKNQLGHSPASNELERIYGVYINAAKLTEQQERRMTAAATDVRAKREATRAK